MTDDRIPNGAPAQLTHIRDAVGDGDVVGHAHAVGGARL